MVLQIDLKKNDPSTLILSWKGEFWREVSKSLFINDLKKIAGIGDWDEFLRQFQSLEEKLAKRQAISFLAKRSYLALDLQAKLISQGISPPVAERTIHFCQEKGYLNDGQVLARQISKLQNKGLAAKAIYFKLKQKKGVSEQQLRHALEHAELSEKQVLQRWLNKHARKIDRADRLQMKKLMAKLLRSGFSAELVWQSFEV